MYTVNFDLNLRNVAKNIYNTSQHHDVFLNWQKFKILAEVESFVNTLSGDYEVLDEDGEVLLARETEQYAYELELLEERSTFSFIAKYQRESRKQD